MGTLYMATPRATSAPFDVVEVALAAATLKSVLQVATPSTTQIRIIGWGISFDGTSATASPGRCALIDCNVAATVLTIGANGPEKWESSLAPASLCVGGTAATGYNASAEGTLGDCRYLDSQEVHPQGGYAVFFPESRHPVVQSSRFVRIRCLFGAVVNCLPWILWEEPA